MKITINVNGKDTEIELTDAQVAVVKKASTKITDRIKTFQDVLNETGKPDPINAFDRVALIVEAFNEGWAPDWSNSSQYKYTPYFTYQNNAFVFDRYDCWFSITDVPSRLCFKSSELATYVAKQFIKEYNDLYR